MAKEKGLKDYDIMVMGGGQVKNLPPEKALALSEELSQVVQKALVDNLTASSTEMDIEVQTMVEEVYPDPSPEERSRRVEQGEEAKKGMLKDIEETSRKTLAAEFDIANRWADRAGVDVTPREAVHGAVWEIHNERDNTKFKHHESKGEETDILGTMLRGAKEAPIYAQIYEERLSDLIKAGDIMSAKDLFD